MAGLHPPAQRRTALAAAAGGGTGYALPLGEGLATALPANHSVPALGWLIEGSWRALAFSGDSGPCPAFWQWVSNVPSLTDVICELTYTDERQAEAARQGHMTPALLLPFLPQLPANTHLWISHIDPGAANTCWNSCTRNTPTACASARCAKAC